MEAIMKSCADIDKDGDLIMKAGNDVDLQARFSILAPLKGDLLGKSATEILSMAEGPSNPTFLHENLSPLLLPSYPREIVNNFKETPIFTVKSSDHAKSKEFVEFLSDKHMVLIKDLPKAVGMKLSAFYTDTLAKKDPDHRGIEVRDQLNNEYNLDIDGNPIWGCDSYFLPKKEAKEYTTGKCAQYQRDLYAMDDFVRENQERCIFCTNFDLTSERGDLYQEQLQELEKFPTLLRVNDEADLLNQQGHKVHGMNVPQVYLKVPNNKTAAHVENMCMTSVNVNVGMREGVQGACMWYAVPYEYYGVINDHLKTKKSEQKPNGLDFLRDTWWPDAEELMDMGVPVYRCVQEVGDTIWIAPGVVHWVVSIGFTNNVAWNVCPMTHVQLTVALHQYQWNKQERYQSLVPMINLFWRIAKHVKVMDEKVFKLVKKCLIRSLAFSKIVTEWAIEQKIKIIDKPRPTGEGPSFCDVCTSEVFNLVFRKKSTEKKRRMIYCVECMREDIMTTGKADFSVTREYTEDYLKQTFDNFHLHNADTLLPVINQKRRSIDKCVQIRKKIKKEANEVELRLPTEEIPAEVAEDFTEEPLTKNDRENEPLISFVVGETVFAKERASDTHVFPAMIDRVDEDKGKKRYFVNYTNEWKASGRWVEAFEVDFLVFKEKDVLEDSGVELDTVCVEESGSEEEDDDEEEEEIEL